MNSIDKLIDSLYTHFLLRDITGKVLPGLGAGAVIVISLFPHGMKVIKSLSRLQPVYLAIILYGVGLLLGLFLQHIGKYMKLNKVFIWDSMKQSRE